MCVEAKAVSDMTSLHVEHIGAGRSRGVAGKTGFGLSNGKVILSWINVT